MAGIAISSSVPEELPPEPLADDIELPPDSGEGEPVETSIEVRAREMGWKPLSEYRGPPGRWKPAAEFVSHGENTLPILRDQFRRQGEEILKVKSEVGGLRVTVDEQLKIIKDLRDMGLRANQAGYDRAMADIKARQRQAVEQGDTKGFDQLVEQAEALASLRPAAPVTTTTEPSKPAEPPRPALSPAVQTFIGQNSWFNNDAFLTRKMIDTHIDVVQEGEIADEGAQLAEAKQRLIDAYPDRFGVTAARDPAPRPPAPRRRAAAVSAPTNGQDQQNNRGAAQNTINSITDPTEREQVRKAFKRLQHQLPDTTEADYMAIYNDPHGDVLALQQQKPRAQPNGR